ncbi:DUF6586 family protein [Microbulbifer hydrolyticus]|uniref:PasA protein n=1 Tax=Microbulbifer hydrolyticus TaxID=48074 RepID=A0A6P1TCI9_9GAMM|nr:DUF6586 family protein [Microbulbifer hydrolyticus]MBB5210574.1 hypothetical protein [Microbulbifer hydrolyticus]QHQ38959.1 hypothetical protein GTQ55_08160 [Microbulbifer hydrolyticus]
MSNPYTCAVASALRKAQLILHSLASPEGAGSQQALYESAQHEAALLQLWRAYKAFLAEQGQQLQLGFGPGGEPETAHALAQLVSARGKFSAEVNELVSLAENPDSWFQSMAAAWQALWQPATGTAQQPAASAVDAAGGQSLIPLQQLDRRAPEPLGHEALEKWLRALNELVQRQRAHGEEW